MGFFPDIDLDAMRDTQRLDGTVTTVRLQAEVVEAMLHANAELSAWRALREAEGYTSLADVKRVDGRPVPEVGGKTRSSCVTPGRFTAGPTPTSSSGTGISTRRPPRGKRTRSRAPVPMSCGAMRHGRSMTSRGNGASPWS
nr:head completion/stabilization protein [Pandoraea pnomenusa]